jgi:hypothetical protein
MFISKCEIVKKFKKKDGAIDDNNKEGINGGLEVSIKDCKMMYFFQLYIK